MEDTRDPRGGIHTSISSSARRAGPAAAQRCPGHQLVPAQPPAGPAGRAQPAIDAGRRGQGSIFGAFEPATGTACTAPDAGRPIANGVAFVDHVAGWRPAGAERVYAILDTLSRHRAPEVVRVARAHPRWAFSLQPQYAASLNLIEP